MMSKSCTSPLYRVPVGSLNYGRLIPSDQSRVRNGGVFLPYEAIKAYEGMPGWSSDSVQIIRCGQCRNCRLMKSFEWAVRCSLEAAEYKHNYFVTLTYDDFHLPKKACIDLNGVFWDSELCRRDVQLFIKNLREYERIHYGNTGIKVFYCGEYGDLNGRPHYHLCLFGVSELEDLTLVRVQSNFKYYRSLTYEKCWSDSSFVKGLSIPRGFVDISELSFDTVAYTARYTMKKITGKLKKDFLQSEAFLSCGLPLRAEPFIGMSLKPGIGAAYFSRNKDQILIEDCVKYQKKYKLFLAKTPRYFSRLLEREFPEDYLGLVRRRCRAGIESRKFKIKRISESELDRMIREDDISLARSKKQVRCL